MIEVYIEKCFMTKKVDIYVFEKDRQDRKYYVAKPMTLDFVPEERKDGHKLINPPTMTLERHQADDFLKAFAKALSEIDVKLEPDSVLKGKLDASLYHLEDMRTLLKLDKKK